jgi:RNA polymerase sigma-70 factor (ECF subfamily)
LAAIPPASETSLVSRAQQGDRSAFGELVRMHQQGVIRVVYHLCGDTSLADDAAQEAFIQAWMHLPAYRPESPLRNWLYRIAVNAALDMLRREKRMDGQDIDILPLEDTHPGPESILIEKDRSRQVQKAIQALPASSRAVLVLREYEEFSYQEIAAALDIPLGTVMSRLNYARTRLREMFATELYFVEVEHV